LLTGPNDGAADIIRDLAPGEEVTLLGEAKGLWVFVATADGVRPGWISARDLRRADGGGSAEPRGAQAARGPTATPTAQRAQVRLEPDRPLADPPRPSPIAQEAVPIAVLLVQTHARTPNNATPVPGAATPTPDLERMRAEQPLAGMRVQLVNVFGDVLTEAVTPDDGRVTLARDVPPGTALAVLIPATGVLVPVAWGDDDTPELVIAIPVRAGQGQQTAGEAP
jgi:hypothetical protein